MVLFVRGLPNWFSFSTYPLQVRFDYAPGVTAGTPVRKSGIRIGEVESIRLADDDSNVMVTILIQKDRTIYNDEECYLTQNFLGDTVANSFVPSEPRPAVRGPWPANTILEGRLSEDPTGLKRALAGPIRTVNDTGEAAAGSQHRAQGRRTERQPHPQCGGRADPQHAQERGDALGPSATSWATRKPSDGFRPP